MVRALRAVMVKLHSSIPTSCTWHASFETAGVDFRAVVMMRDAGSLLRSTTEHRHYGERDEFSKILSDNAIVLHGHLVLLDPAF